MIRLAHRSRVATRGESIRSFKRDALKRASMMKQSVPRARLLVDVPADRFRIISPNGRAPRSGDMVELDQGFTGPDGLPMGLVHFPDPGGGCMYEAEVYDFELGELI